MVSALHGWHPGEVAIQRRLNYAKPMKKAYTWVENYLPDQHRLFHNKLPWVPITTLDDKGRPWSSLVAGEGGQAGFVCSPSYDELDMQLSLWPGDPLVRNLESFGDRPKTYVAGLGIEFETRRRNKFAGWITEAKKGDKKKIRLSMQVNQVIGNCPKYINVRKLTSMSRTSPEVVYEKLEVPDGEFLPEELVSLIHESDTVFVGSSYDAPSEVAREFPSHVGANARGGLPGFVRVRSDRRTVVVPDYSGNRLMTSLGNIELTGLASLTFTNFLTGDILYLTGEAKNIVGSEAQEIMSRHNVLTSVYVTGYVYVRDAVPVRQTPGTSVERSPYSPPVKLLADETGLQTTYNDVFVTLSKIKPLSPTLITFTFCTPQPVHIKPGQAAVLDFNDLLGAGQYQHMAIPGNESSLNDDRIRTWTVSSAHSKLGTREFSLTMRLKTGGLATGALFALARKLEEARPEMLEDVKPLGVKLRLSGIAGEFTIRPSSTRLFWAAGGIGVTPFLSMLGYIAASPETAEEYDVYMVLSTREPDLLLELIKQSLGETELRSFVLDLFSNEAVSTEVPSGLALRLHTGRLERSYFERNQGLKATERDVFVCGPAPFEQVVIRGLGDIGVATDKVMREGFGY